MFQSTALKLRMSQTWHAFQFAPSSLIFEQPVTCQHATKRSKGPIYSSFKNYMMYTKLGTKPKGIYTSCVPKQSSKCELGHKTMYRYSVPYLMTPYGKVGPWYQMPPCNCMNEALVPKLQAKRKTQNAGTDQYSLCQQSVCI